MADPNSEFLIAVNAQANEQLAGVLEQLTALGNLENKTVETVVNITVGKNELAEVIKELRGLRGGQASGEPEPKPASAPTKPNETPSGEADTLAKKINKNLADQQTAVNAQQKIVADTLARPIEATIKSEVFDDLVAQIKELAASVARLAGAKAGGKTGDTGSGETKPEPPGRTTTTTTAGRGDTGKKQPEDADTRRSRQEERRARDAERRVEAEDNLKAFTQEAAVRKVAARDLGKNMRATFDELVAAAGGNADEARRVVQKTLATAQQRYAAVAKEIPENTPSPFDAKLGRLKTRGASANFVTLVKQFLSERLLLQDELTKLQAAHAGLQTSRATIEKYERIDTYKRGGTTADQGLPALGALLHKNVVEPLRDLAALNFTPLVEQLERLASGGGLGGVASGGTATPPGRAGGDRRRAATLKAQGEALGFNLGDDFDELGFLASASTNAELRRAREQAAADAKAAKRRKKGKRTKTAEEQAELKLELQDADARAGGGQAERRVQYAGQGLVMITGNAFGVGQEGQRLLLRDLEQQNSAFNQQALTKQLEPVPAIRTDAAALANDPARFPVTRFKQQHPLGKGYARSEYQTEYVLPKSDVDKLFVAKQLDELVFGQGQARTGAISGSFIGTEFPQAGAVLTQEQLQANYELKVAQLARLRATRQRVLDRKVGGAHGLNITEGPDGQLQYEVVRDPNKDRPIGSPKYSYGSNIKALDDRIAQLEAELKQESTVLPPLHKRALHPVLSLEGEEGQAASQALENAQGNPAYFVRDLVRRAVQLRVPGSQYALEHNTRAATYTSLERQRALQEARRRRQLGYKGVEYYEEPSPINDLTFEQLQQVSPELRQGGFRRSFSLINATALSQGDPRALLAASTLQRLVEDRIKGIVGALPEGRRQEATQELTKRLGRAPEDAELQSFLEAPFRVRAQRSIESQLHLPKDRFDFVLGESADVGALLDQEYREPGKGGGYVGRRKIQAINQAHRKNVLKIQDAAKEEAARREAEIDKLLEAELAADTDRVQALRKELSTYKTVSAKPPEAYKANRELETLKKHREYINKTVAEVGPTVTDSTLHKALTANIEHATKEAKAIIEAGGGGSSAAITAAQGKLEYFDQLKTFIDANQKGRNGPEKIGRTRILETLDSAIRKKETAYEKKFGSLSGTTQDLAEAIPPNEDVLRNALRSKITEEYNVAHPAALFGTPAQFRSWRDEADRVVGVLDKLIAKYKQLDELKHTPGAEAQVLGLQTDISRLTGEVAHSQQLFPALHEFFGPVGEPKSYLEGLVSRRDELQGAIPKLDQFLAGVPEKQQLAGRPLLDEAGIAHNLIVFRELTAALKKYNVGGPEGDAARSLIARIAENEGYGQGSLQDFLFGDPKAKAPGPGERDQRFGIFDKIATRLIPIRDELGKRFRDEQGRTEDETGKPYTIFDSQDPAHQQYVATIRRLTSATGASDLLQRGIFQGKARSAREQLDRLEQEQQQLTGQLYTQSPEYRQAVLEDAIRENQRREFLAGRVGLSPEAAGVAGRGEYLVEERERLRNDIARVAKAEKTLVALPPRPEKGPNELAFNYWRQAVRRGAPVRVSAGGTSLFPEFLQDRLNNLIGARTNVQVTRSRISALQALEESAPTGSSNPDVFLKNAELTPELAQVRDRLQSARAAHAHYTREYSNAAKDLDRLKEGMTFAVGGGGGAGAGGGGGVGTGGPEEEPKPEDKTPLDPLNRGIDLTATGINKLAGLDSALQPLLITFTKLAEQAMMIGRNLNTPGVLETIKLTKKEVGAAVRAAYKQGLTPIEQDAFDQEQLRKSQAKARKAAGFHTEARFVSGPGGIQDLGAPPPIEGSPEALSRLSYEAYAAHLTAVDKRRQRELKQRPAPLSSEQQAEQDKKDAEEQTKRDEEQAKREQRRKESDARQADRNARALARQVFLRNQGRTPTRFADPNDLATQTYATSEAFRTELVRRAEQEAIKQDRDITRQRELAQVRQRATQAAQGTFPRIGYGLRAEHQEEIETYRAIGDAVASRRRAERDIFDSSRRAAAARRLGLDDTSDLNAVVTHEKRSQAFSDRTTEYIRRAQQVGIASFQKYAPALQKIQQLETDLVKPENQRAEAQKRINEEIKRTTASLHQQAGLDSERARAAERQLTLAQRFHEVLRRVALYSGATFLLFNVFGKVYDAVRQAVELEAVLTRIQGILGTSGVASRNDLKQQVQDIAVKYGVPQVQAAQTLQVFAQAGYRGAAATRATDIAIQGQIGSGLDAGQVQELLVAIDNISQGTIGFQEILDRISRVESTKAVSGQDLADALKRAGPIVEQLQPKRLGGIDFADVVIGATTQIVEKTRVSGDQAATALKFIASRIITPRTANVLQKDFGIQLAASEPGPNGQQLRPLLDILADIAAKYKELRPGGQPTVESQRLLLSVAGLRQANLAAALFDDFDNVLKSATESGQAFGDTQRRTALQMETLQAQIGRMGTSFQRFVDSLLEHSGIIYALAHSITPSASSVFQTAARHPTATLGTLAGGFAASAGALGVGSIVLNRFVAEPIKTKLGPKATRFAELIGGVPIEIEQQGTRSLAGGAARAAQAAEVAAVRSGAVSQTVRRGLGGAAIDVAESGAGAVAFSRTLSGFAKLGGALALVTLALYGLEAVVSLVTKKRREQEADEARFGFSKLTAGSLRTGEFFEQYGEQARTVGLTSEELYRKVSAAAAATQAEVERRHPGAAFFTATEEERARIPGINQEINDEFQKQLKDAGVPLERLGDAAAQAAFATDALAKSQKYGGVVVYAHQQDVLAKGEEFAAKLQQDAVDRIKAISDAGPPGIGAAFLSGLQNVVNPLGDVAGTPEQFAKRFGTTYSGDVGRLRGSLEVQDLEAIVNQLTDKTGSHLFSDLSINGERFGKVLADLVNKGATAGQALDHLTLTYFSIDEDTKSRVDKRALELVKTQGLAPADARKQAIAQLGLTQQYELNTQFDAAIAKGVAERFHFASREDFIREQQHPGEASGPGGLAFVARVAEGTLRATVEAAQKIKGLADPEVQALERLKDALQSEKGRTQFTAAIREQGGRHVLRDRLIDVLLDYQVTRRTAERGAQYFQGTGLSVDVAAERARASQQALQGLAGVEFQLQRDLLKIQQGTGGTVNLSDVIPETLNALEGQGRNAGGLNNPVLQAVLGPADQAFKDLLVSPETTERVQEQVEFIKSSLEALRQNKPFFGTLTESAKQFITETGIDDIKNGLVTTFTQLVALMKQAATYDENVLATRRELVAVVQHEAALAKLEVDYRTRALSQQLRVEQAVADARGSEAGALAQREGIADTYNLARQQIEQNFASNREKILAENPVDDNKRRELLRQNERDRVLALRGAGDTALLDLNNVTLQKNNEHQLAVIRTSQQAADSSTAGLKSALQGLDEFRRTGVQGILGPLAQTYSKLTTDTFVDSLFGPNGLLKLSKAFESPAEEMARLQFGALQSGSDYFVESMRAMLQEVLATAQAAVTAYASNTIPGVPVVLPPKPDISAPNLQGVLAPDFSNVIGGASTALPDFSTVVGGASTAPPQSNFLRLLRLGLPRLATAATFGPDPKVAHWRQLVDAFADADLDDPKVLRALYATVQTETGGTLKPIRELYSGKSRSKYFEKKYGYKTDVGKALGNLKPGDGAKYYGRGYIQLTGRSNYAEAGKALGLDLINHPDLALDPENAARIAAWFFEQNGVDDAAKKGDLRQVRRLVNGGLTNFADFKRYYRSPEFDRMKGPPLLGTAASFRDNPIKTTRLGATAAGLRESFEGAGGTLFDRASSALNPVPPTISYGEKIQGAPKIAAIDLTNLDLSNVPKFGTPSSISDSLLFAASGQNQHPIADSDVEHYRAQVEAEDRERESLEADQRARARDAALVGALRTAGVFAGGAIGEAIGGRGSGANMGSQLGGFAGSTIAAAAGVAGPWGGVIAAGGALLGGIVGGLFGGGPEKPRELTALESVERNTRETVTAITSQSKLLDPGIRFFNVPSSFAVPSYSPDNVNGSAPTTVNITIHDARDPDRVAKAVAQELRNSSRASGRYVDIRR